MIKTYGLDLLLFTQKIHSYHYLLRSGMKSCQIATGFLTFNSPGEQRLQNFQEQIAVSILLLMSV